MYKSTANKILVFGLGGFLILATLFCVFPLDYFVYKIGTKYTVHVMLSLFAMGFLFLFAGQKELMYTSFICCGIVCFFLQESFDEDLLNSFYSRPTQERIVNVAHFNLSSSEGDYQTTVNTILDTDADLVSVQELTPDWDMVLQEGLKNKYPFNKSVVRIDFHGMAVYSKFPFVTVDTFNFEGIPNIMGSVEVDSTHGEVFFLSSHMMPPLNYTAYQSLSRHLRKVAAFANSIDGPLLAFGDYNVVPWSDEIKRFRSTSSLFSGRKDFTPSFSSTSTRFFQSPIDHIFYSSHFQCVSFNNILSKSSSHLGIKGEFQFKYSVPYVKGSF